MKELQAIIEARAKNPEATLALATLVKSSGSTYRRPGARMLILPNGEAIGSISGGCVETDVIQNAAEIAKSGRSAILTYDTSTEEDILFGAGLGCKGEVHILVEPVHPLEQAADREDLISFVAELFHRRESAAVVTIIAAPAQSGARVGARVIATAHGAGMGNVGDEALSAAMMEDARQALQHGRAANVEHVFAGGVVEVFAEVIHSPAPLVIFGAGYDAVPLVRLARELGHHITVVDKRPAYATPKRFPLADVVKVAQPEDDLEDQFQLTRRTAVVVMSHNYMADRAFLKTLLPLPLLYLGVMGPRKRAEKMIEELRREGAVAGDDVLGRIHNPIGLDIGAETPEQIALAILGEIQAVISGHAGGLLREKRGPIHAPRAASAPAQSGAVPA
jgi:xanthine/CO dehydrogenase XdhC/CoxF family maturation factor